MSSTPIVFLIYNRPNLTSLVFAEIAKTRPPKLLVVADGPRRDRPDDIKKCAEVRAIVENIDWDCQVLKNYSDSNLGCGRRVSSGLSWAFEQVEEAIILEDDTLPHPSFFKFCDELLSKYRDDERVMHISGNNHLLGRRPCSYSYYFSRYDHIWGWASWRRAWQHYDYQMQLWPTVRQTSLLLDLLGDQFAAEWRRDNFNSISAGQIDTWDGQWLYSIWLQNGLSITPAVNLVTNIGYGIDATHTISPDGDSNRLARCQINFPLVHPPFMVPDRDADGLAFQRICNPQARSLVSAVLPRVVRSRLASLRSKYR